MLSTKRTCGARILLHGNFDIILCINKVNWQLLFVSQIILNPKNKFQKFKILYLDTPNYNPSLLSSYCFKKMLDPLANLFGHILIPITKCIITDMLLDFLHEP